MSENQCITLHLPDGDIAISYSGQPVLLDLLRDNGFAISAPCGGDGRCGGCAVCVSGCVSAPEKAEADLLGDKIKDGIRLACRVRLYGACEIKQYKNEISYIKSPVESKDGLTTEKSCMLAVDIGTTTAAVRLLDADGAVLCEKSKLNCQRSYGADVLTRVSRCAHGMLDEQHRAIQAQLAAMTADMLCQTGRGLGDITSCAVVGNPAMLHIFAGISPAALGEYPYDTGERFGALYNTDCGGLPDKVYLAPCIGGFTGGDLVAVLAALGSVSEGTCVCDLGTNGELAVRCASGWLVCSTAAGPALEGGGISCGTGGVSGAISRVEQSESGGLVFYRLSRSEKLSGFGVDGQTDAEQQNDRPAGLTGSALIDLTAILLHRGIIDRTGRMECGSWHITGDLYLTQADVRQLQLAKGAIAAALLRMSRETKIERLIITGGLGCRINTRSALDVGLIPRALGVSEVSFAPALALDGAALMCKSGGRAAAEDIARSCTELILTGDSAYDELFIDCMEF